MKHLKILIPNLIATISTPLISFAGCSQPTITTTYVVTLYADEGTFGDSNQIILSDVKPNTPLKNVPGYKEPRGSEFKYWMNNGIEFDKEMPITSNLLLTAFYDNDQEEHVITLFANGGTFEGETSEIINRKVLGKKTTIAEAIDGVVPKGETEFTGWVDQNNKSPNMHSFVTKDLILKATYASKPTDVRHVVTLFASGGIFPTKQTDILNFEVIGDTTKLINIPGYELPQLDEESFIKWVDSNGADFSETTVVDTDLILQAVYSQSPEPTPHSFTRDPWDTINYFAKKGVAALHKAYANDCLNNQYIKGTLIGLTRYVDINGYAHKVVVLDENKDYYEKDGVRHYAPLTFQFQDLVSDSSGKRIKIEWDTYARQNYSYWSSLLDNKLNDEQDPAVYSVYEMIKDGNNQNLHEFMKPVMHATHANSDGKSYEVIAKPTKLFAPNLANIYSPFGLKESHYIGGQGTGLEQKVSQEGQQYIYFRLDDPADQKDFFVRDKKIEDYSFCLEKYDFQGAAFDKCAFWLSSPTIDRPDLTFSTWGKTQRESISGGYYWRALAPLFSI